MTKATAITPSQVVYQKKSSKKRIYLITLTIQNKMLKTGYYKALLNFCRGQRAVTFRYQKLLL